MVETAGASNGFERRRMRSRAALLDAAIELFQQQGVSATKLEEICEAAGVSPRTFFNHFETRDHLYEAIAAQRGGQIAALIEERARDGRPFRRQLGGLLDEIGAFIAARPAYRELMREMLSLRTGAGSATARQIGDALLHFVEAGVARGEVTRAHRPEVLADLILGAITGALSRWCDDDAYDLPDALEQTGRALNDLCSPRRNRP